MSLYLKYRPTNLDQVKGNSDVISALTKMLSNKQSCPHSFLLTGPTGCGKTTIGRIIARELGCIGGDFREVDSADFRGIDTVRELRQNTRFKALEGECKVYLIDECHKMTNDAQNALLKVLEDTPAHIYFILCTTDPQKLIATIKGRCSQFQVKLLTDSQMLSLLRRVVRQEGAEITDEDYQNIVKQAAGHPRNALNILEQVLNVEPEERSEIVKQAEENAAQVIELCRALLAKESWKTISTILTGLKEQDIEAEGVRRAVLGYCQAVLLKGDNVRAAVIVEQFWDNFYDIGFPGLTYAAYSCTKN